MTIKKLPNGALFLDLNGVKGLDENGLVIRWPDHLKNPISVSNGKTFLLSTSPKEKISNIIFVKKPIRSKIMKRKQKQDLMKKILSEMNCNQLLSKDWKPIHILQYIKLRWRKKYGKLSLELNWKDRGYTENPTQRAKCWGYAKGLLDKLEKHGIKNRAREYINWCFDSRKEMIPSMSLISCNNWIDEFYFSNIKSMNEENNGDEERYKKSLRKLKNGIL